MKRLTALMSLSVLMATGCSPVKVLDLDQSKVREAKPADCEIDPYFQKAPERPHEVIGQLRYAQQVKTMAMGVSTNNGSRQEALQALNKKACELGADALLITDENHDKSGMTAQVLVYTDT